MHYAILPPETRKSIVSALMLLRSKNNIDQVAVLSLFFDLLRCRDKALRAQLVNYVVLDIKNSNTKCKNVKLNKSLQNYLFGVISMADQSSGDAADVAAKYCLDICIQLYRKQIWNDNKTVNVIAEALFSVHAKVLVTALKFFLGTDIQDDQDGSEDEGVPDMDQLRFRATVAKKSRSRQNKLEKAVKVVKRKERKSNRAEIFNFSALHLVNDPQGLSEKVFSRLEQRKSMVDGGGKTFREIKFEIRLMMMNLISRIVGLHKLILLNFYPYLVRYVVI